MLWWGISRVWYGIVWYSGVYLGYDMVWLGIPRVGYGMVGYT